MTNVRGWAGLYVHARSVLAVTMDSETGELRLQRLSGDAEKVRSSRLCCRARRGRRMRPARPGTARPRA